nr:DENN (AEX-3) domain-containing protein [Tanacetum cinerariifolium]
MEKGNLAREQPSSTGWGALFFVHTRKTYLQLLLLHLLLQHDRAVLSLKGPHMNTIFSRKSVAAESVADICDSRVDYNVSNKQPSQKHIPNAILPLLRYQQYDSSDSSSSFQGSPSEDRSLGVTLIQQIQKRHISPVKRVTSKMIFLIGLRLFVN